MRFDHSLGFRRGVAEEGERRKLLAQKIRIHRKYNVEGSYERERDFEWLKGLYSFDAAKFIAGILPQGRKLNVLDSGAGFLGVSSDLKKVFGSKVFVTSLNIVHPAMKESVKNGKEKIYSKQKEMHEYFARVRKEYSPLLAERAKLVDEVRVSALETFNSRRKYDVIFDFFGPLYYTPFKSAALQKYFSALSENGILVVDYEIDKIIGESLKGGVWVDPLTSESFKLTRQVISTNQRGNEVYAYRKVSLN